MIALLQRVSNAKVTIAGEITADINHGLLVFIAVEPTDYEQVADKLLHRILNYRLFEDQQGKMNLSVSETQGGVLFVPQFTLAADTQKGLRPSFSHSASPELGRALFHYLYQRAQQQHNYPIACGQFGADMQVSLTNEGPATFWLQCH